MHALILADGDAPERAGLDAAWPSWDADVAFVVAADGGARLADALGLVIDRWVGDGDSLGVDGLADLVARGVPMELARPDKDESDTELAVAAALGVGATRLTIVGALGGERFDHALANIGLLGLAGLAGLDVRIVDAGARVRLLWAPSADGSPASVMLDGRLGESVSLLPLGGDVAGVTTTGLQYALHDEPLLGGSSRGLSNVRTAARASVSARDGRLFIVETPGTIAS